MSIAPGESVGGRGRRRAVARSAAAIAVLLVGSGGAAAEDPPRPPAPPAPESPKPEPRQDPEAVAALRRLAELVPSPFSGGQRELRCIATLQSDLPFAVRARVRWPADGIPEVEVDLPVPLLKPGTAEPLRKRFAHTLAFPFIVRGFWEPSIWATNDVAAERRDRELALTFSRHELTIAETGLPGTIRWIHDDAERGPRQIWMTFAPHVTGHALSRLAFCPPGTPHRGIDLWQYEHVLGTILPRRIVRRLGDAESETFLLHDYVLDGKPVEGTSLAEARAERRRVVDRRADSAFFRWAGAIAGGTADPVPTAACLVEYETGRSRYRFRVAWRHGVLERCEPEVAADEPLESARTAWGVAQILSPRLEDRFRPPSRQHMEFDASMAASQSAPLVLESLVEGSPVRRRHIRLDVGGLPVDAEVVFRDGYPPCTMQWEWGPFRDKHIQVSDTVTRGGRKTVTRYIWYDVPGFPPLLRSEERTLTGGDDAGVYVQRFSDWVIDGRPVPGTESSPPAAPPDAPK